MAFALELASGLTNQACHPSRNVSVGTEIELRAIERGLAYVRRHLSPLSSNSDVSGLVVLDYLQRRYGLPTDLAFESTYDTASNVQLPRAWHRFVGGERLTDESALGHLSKDSGIEEIITHSLHCDVSPLPDWFGRRLLEFVNHGGYELTHAVLAGKLLHDNNCALDASSVVDLSPARLRHALSKLLQHVPENPAYEELDVRYEALALTVDVLEQQKLPKAEVARVLREQQSDGGWKPEADHGSRLHPTILAIWALLAHVHPDAPVIRFARR